MQVLLLVCVGVLLGTCAPAAEPKAPTAEEMAQWVKQLGDDDFATRAEAEQKLSVCGEAAIPLLEGVSKSPDAEVQIRSARLLQDLRAVPLEKKFLAMFENAKGFEAKIETSRKYANNEYKAAGTVTAHPDGKKYAYATKAEQAGFSSQQTIIGDGTSVWAEVEYEQQNKKQKNVQKASTARIDKSRAASMPMLSFGLHGHPVQSLRNLTSLFRFGTIEETKQDGVDVTVFHGVARADAGQVLTDQFSKIYGPDSGVYMAGQTGGMSKVRVAFGRDGVVRKAELIDDKGETTAFMTLSEVKPLAEVEENKFKYEPGSTNVMEIEKTYNLGND
jgi:outer membrane lipoprotein-sorting protein